MGAKCTMGRRSPELMPRHGVVGTHADAATALERLAACCMELACMRPVLARTQLACMVGAIGGAAAPATLLLRRVAACAGKSMCLLFL